MPKKKITLPEHIVKDESEVLSEQAKNAMKEREEANYHTAEEKEWKQKIAINAGALRELLLNEDKIIGKITIAPPNQTTCRVEFRINNGSQDTNEMDNLDKLFEDARPELFEIAEIVTSINDPLALIKTLTNAGLNPWDYLVINVKSGMDKKIIDLFDTEINTTDAILPRQGFMAKLPDLWKYFSEEAKLFIKNYLKLALKPTVVLGTKTKANK